MNKFAKTLLTSTVSIITVFTLSSCSTAPPETNTTPTPVVTVSPAEIKTEFQELLQQSLIETKDNGVLEETNTLLKAYNPYYINYDPNAALSGVLDKTANVYSVPSTPIITNIQTLEYVLGDNTVDNDTKQPIKVKIEKPSENIYLVTIPAFNADLAQQTEKQVLEITIKNGLLDTMTNVETGEIVQIKYGDLRINEIIAKANQNRG